MHLDTILTVSAFKDVAQLARTVEDMGFDALWSLENRHEPFMPLAVAASVTDKLYLGTSIALAFVRSPMNLAYTAWDLQAGSNGRFILGLGTQVKGHNERRYNVKWESPGPKLRELVQALRAIWDCWQNGTKLDFNGKFYSFTLMPPAFSPGKIAHPHVPIYVAGVNPYMCRLAGELADGFHVHPFHSTTYLRNAVLPQIGEGARKAGRSRTDVVVTSSVFAIMGESKKEIDEAREEARRQIAFYASTRTYKPVLDAHGWGDVCLRLHEKTVKGDWAGMPQEISDAMMAEYTITGSPQEMPKLINERYNGLLDRVAFYYPYHPGQDEKRWRKIVETFRS
ncbi:MAG: TIGR03617 family F420-dependent LLM class oxidoreductase [Deltaproteobacteria bacterium]|nr:TIGR03617 family F420-dependent LLM class oxidoreductase [Deltaproteobacteria bacterium]